MIRPYIFATIGFALLLFTFYVIIPAWNSFASNVDNTLPSLPLGSYNNFVGQLVSNVNSMVFAIFPLAVVGLIAYLFVYAWRRESGTEEV
jgi:TRAP-type C4-dicarboxylate transport system permease small subunit